MDGGGRDSRPHATCRTGGRKWGIVSEESSYVYRAVGAFRHKSTRHLNDNGEHAVLLGQSRDLIQPFIIRFYPVLRHYSPEIVGQCLAVSYDDPDLALRSERHGFGLYMQAGDHPHDQESRLGSFRDDGSYLALVAHDYFAGVLR